MRWFTRSPQVVKLTVGQMEILRRFRDFESGTDDIRTGLAKVFEFDFSEPVRKSKTRFRVPEPGIRVALEHISAASERAKSGQISGSELAGWATMILLNDAYELDSEDEDAIAQWLNETSMASPPTSARHLR